MQSSPVWEIVGYLAKNSRQNGFAPLLNLMTEPTPKTRRNPWDSIPKPQPSRP